MFGGPQRRVVSMWFPRLSSDRFLRQKPVSGPFALTMSSKNTNRLYCMNAEAERQGLQRGMPYSDARAFCPNLASAPASPGADVGFLHILQRWALRYCPYVGLEGRDGLVLDITGASHLFSGEEGMFADMRQRLMRAGVSVRLGLADTRGAAWALAHYGEGIAAPEAPLATLKDLPVEALRPEEGNVIPLQRLGLRTIGDLEAADRASLARRFGPALLRRLDQALGRHSEQIVPLADPPHYGVRITLPEPIGLLSDVMAVTRRLLEQLCARLAKAQTGARVLRLTFYRVDREAEAVELRLARPLRDAARILPLFERSVEKVDAAFGIELVRIEATEVLPLPAEQICHDLDERSDKLDDLLNRIGTRIGIENIQKFQSVESHLPDKAFRLVPAATPLKQSNWFTPQPRPIRFFAPEPIGGSGSQPPGHFRWRRMTFTTAHASGPERIAPEWWMEDASWNSGVRDYWRVSTREGRRLWLFHTPQNPGWFVQGEFP